MTLDLATLNAQHLRTSDKFFRMFAGAASIITAFEDGVISLEIRVDNRLRLPLETITCNIAESWFREKELRLATGYIAHIYKTERLLGFALSLKNSSSPDLATEVIRRTNEIARHYPDILLAIIHGTF